MGLFRAHEAQRRLADPDVDPGGLLPGFRTSAGHAADPHRTGHRATRGRLRRLEPMVGARARLAHDSH